MDKMKYRELEAEYVKYVLSDEFHFEHRALYEKVQTKGYGICPRCEYRYGCSQCDPEKAFSFFARKTLWDKVSSRKASPKRSADRPLAEPWRVSHISHVGPLGMHSP